MSTRQAGQRPCRTNLRALDNENQIGQLWGYELFDDGCEGNYWSGYNGTDSDFDGIGDTPYIIDSNNIDHYPLMNPYWIPADVNHDLIVSILDVVKITGAYGKKAGDPLYTDNADIDNNGLINILDVVLCTGHYGGKYP